MRIYTGGKSTAISSPRYLVLRHRRRAAKARRRAAGLLLASDDDDPDRETNLQPGEEKLNSFWRPGLEAGQKHKILVKQTVQPPNGDAPLELLAEQDFSVNAPRFSLPEGSVYSVYPPPGYPDERRILPHVVLSDPHLPWERYGSLKKENLEDSRSQVPWLAVITFVQEELKLQPGALGTGVNFKQTATLSIKMAIKDMTTIDSISTPSGWDDEEAQAATGEFIFIEPDLFKSLFSTFDGSGQRHVPDKPDATQYKFLSHVRNINTAGMAVAGVEEIGIFSIVVGSRCGPVENKAMVNVSTHLVSLEGIEKMSFAGADKSRVALCSLYSWNHTVLPPETLNVHDAFVNIGKTLGVLSPPAEMIDRVDKAGDKIQQRVAKRLKDGYSMVSYRLQTGEQTVALFRGPFTPTVVPPSEHLTQASNSGQDMLILDQEVGIMDISYSAAWQLGRTLAISDQGFAAALARLRGAIHKQALYKSKIDAVRETAGRRSSFRTRADVLGSLHTTVKKLGQFSQAPRGAVRRPLVGGESRTAFRRWYRPRLNKAHYPRLGFASTRIEDKYDEYAKAAAYELADSTDGSIYDETNSPNSTDWMTVLGWVLDRMFLKGVPAHYLITDPSHLEEERLRFFYIDPNWVDSLIDGALSLANHMGRDRDREAIKHAINRYIRGDGGHEKDRPQIPTYGFYLRSDLVTMFPDLRVTTAPEVKKGDTPDRAPLLLHEIVVDGVMLGLLDRRPASPDFTALIFTQPPHQQRFAIGANLTPDKLEIDIGRQYTADQKTRKTDDKRHDILKAIEIGPDEPDNWLVWGLKTTTTPGVGKEDDDDNDDDDNGGGGGGDDGDKSVKEVDNLRLIRLPFFAEEQLKILQQGMDPKYFDDDLPTSALLAMQLNDPIYNLTIELSKDGGATAATDALGRLKPPSSEQKAINAAIHGPRVLRTVGYSHMAGTKSLVVGADAEDTGAPTPSISIERVLPADGSNMFHRNPHYAPAPFVSRSNLAPNVRAMITLPLREARQADPPFGVPRDHYEAIVNPSPVQSMSSSDPRIPRESDPAGPPVFLCDLYTIGSDVVVQQQDRLAQDLILSIKVANNKYSDYRLMELDIALPLGPIPRPGREEPKPLMLSYDGPGATMINNQRFNVLTVTTTMKDSDDKCLLVRILPRSTSGWVWIKDVPDLSFLLCLSKVHYYPSKETRIQIPTSAYYKVTFEENPSLGSFTATLRSPQLVGGSEDQG